MRKINSNKKCCCGDFCKKVKDIFRSAKGQYDESDEATKKKMIVGAAGALALVAGLFKLRNKKK